MARKLFTISKEDEKYLSSADMNKLRGKKDKRKPYVVNPSNRDKTKYLGNRVCNKIVDLKRGGGIK